MSHEATTWAIRQRGLKPTTKIVLWHLCDRFNPDFGCFPSQNRSKHSAPDSAQKPANCSTQPQRPAPARARPEDTSWVPPP